MNADIGNTENLALVLIAAWAVIFVLLPFVVLPLARRIARVLIEWLHGPELPPFSPYQDIR